MRHPPTPYGGSHSSKPRATQHSPAVEGESMNFILECQAIGLLVLLACASRTETPQAGIPDESIITVSLCQLTRDWEKYDHKIVRIGAIYHTGNEVSQLYDPGCATSDQTAWVKLLPYGSTSPVPPGPKQKLNELLRRTGRAQITAIGEFDGPKKVNIPSGLRPMLLMPCGKQIAATDT